MVPSHVERQARLEADGERVLRVTWAQALKSPEQTVARMAAAGAPFARAPSANRPRRVGGAGRPAAPV